MAQPATTVWEVRPTVGSDSNGGGFVPGASGTDWSQQNSPQYALTGVASSGSGNTVLSTLAAADMVGNIAQCTSGTNFNTGFFEVVSVSVGVSITFGSNAGGSSICTGVGSSGVINIGGALATIKILFRSLYSSAQASNGNTIYIKATGSLAVTATQQNYDINFFTVIGYTSTRGDNGQATITTATNSVILYEIGNGGFSCAWFNINFTNTAGTNADCIYQAGNTFNTLLFWGCTFSGFTNALDLGSGVNALLMIACEIKNCSIGLRMGTCNYIEVDNCYVHGNAIGFEMNPNGSSSGMNAFFNRTVIYNNTTYGVITHSSSQGDGGAGGLLSFWNSAVVSNGSDGVNNVGNASAGQRLFLFNTIVISNGGYGVNCSTAGDNSGAGPMQYGSTNAYYGNTSGARNNFPSLPGDITLTGSPFTNPSGGDFTLNNTAGAGAACKGAGFPSSLP